MMVANENNYMGDKKQVRKEIEEYLESGGDATTNQILQYLKEKTDLDMSDSTDNHEAAHQVLNEEAGEISEIGNSNTYTIS